MSQLTRERGEIIVVISAQNGDSSRLIINLDRGSVGS
jgi:hypothetical protein